ncbi:MAG: nitroreductase family protein [Candidatus Omnitrophica bacterium]|nr:nitroreductase family protein [Candidatus Omnitrophota bacterium]MBD3269458.1 nitroreductase family protein [Candidatus Omnitrophota bacterium]
MKKDVLKLIKERRSVRKFKKKKITMGSVRKILEAGRWAPSGLNNQPWKFMVLQKELKDRLSRYTHYSQVITSADKVILVFLDKKNIYNYEKDLLSIGACIQNMLIFLHSINYGACWLGEILNQRDKINKMLGIKRHLQLEAVIALGEPVAYKRKGERESLKKLILNPP